MRLFHTNFERGLPLADPKRNGIGDWVEFTDQPLAGYGDATYMIDVHESAVKKYEFTNAEPNLIKGIRYFDFPARELTKYRVHTDSYRRLTGRPWNQWLITLKEGTRDRANTWTQVWASRTGVVDVQWIAGRDERVQVTLTDDFDTDNDYLILETQQFYGRQWSLEVLAGVTPEWADFPHRWAEWVHKPEIQNSVLTFLRQEFPDATLAINLAEQEREKVNKIRAWRIVAEKVGHALDRDLGKINAGSWTSTLAMPIKIAEKVGGWTPPIPRPEYADPTESGRICLASPSQEGLPDQRVNGTNYITRRFDAEESPRRKVAYHHH